MAKDYSEQRELSKDLYRGEKKLIAEWTGYSLSTISRMCSGKRKMAWIVKWSINQIYQQRAMFEEYFKWEKNK